MVENLGTCCVVFQCYTRQEDPYAKRSMWKPVVAGKRKQALQVAAAQFAREYAGKLERTKAERAIFKRYCPIGWRVKLSFAQRGTGERRTRPSRGPTACALPAREQAAAGGRLFSPSRQVSRWPAAATAPPGSLGVFPLMRRSTSPSGATRTSCRSGDDVFGVQAPPSSEQGAGFLCAKLFDLMWPESVLGWPVAQEASED